MTRASAKDKADLNMRTSRRECRVESVQQAEPVADLVRECLALLR